MLQERIGQEKQTLETKPTQEINALPVKPLPPQLVNKHHMPKLSTSTSHILFILNMITVGNQINKSQHNSKLELCWNKEQWRTLRNSKNEQNSSVWLLLSLFSYLYWKLEVLHSNRVFPFAYNFLFYNLNRKILKMKTRTLINQYDFI